MDEWMDRQVDAIVDKVKGLYLDYHFEIQSQITTPFY